MSNSVCTSCGAPLDPDGMFCPGCGASVSAVAAPMPPAPPPPPQYQQPAYQQPVYQQPAYRAPTAAAGTAPVLSTGSYIGMMLIACIPLVGFIMLLVWAFGSTENPNKKNYARAVLIISIIVSVLTILITIIAGGAMAALMSEFY